MANLIVIDDSRITRNYLAGLLKEAGHDVVMANNGAEGLDLLAENSPDCIVCDLLMPVLDGFEFLAALKEKQIKVPVIISTADIQDATRERCLGLGALTLVNKPTRKEDLLDAVERAISGAT